MKFIRGSSWITPFGFLFFVGMMAIGYAYNLTFIQFGLIDLGTRLAGLSRQQIVEQMALLAGLTALAALAAGLFMMKLGWSERFLVKLRLAFGVVLAQTVLTAAAPLVRSPGSFTAWIVCASFVLGIGVPATFSMTVDLVPVRYRGYAGALITAGAYFPAAVFSSNWTIETFRAALLPLMFAGVVTLGALAFLPLRPVTWLARQHLQPAYSVGRFMSISANNRPRPRRSLVVLFILMFGIYFVDSLGFLRLAEEPFFFATAWQSPELGPRLVIGITHLLAALVAGVLYSALSEKELFLWIFGIFALVHLMYTISVGDVAGGEPSFAMPVLYAVAVSLYTVINFAVWADVSTPHTISRNSAAGVALSAWTATFISTALALQMQQGGVPLELHFRIVDALAIFFFLVVFLLIFFSPINRKRVRKA